MSTLRIATFNVYNLARAGTPLYERAPRSSGETDDKRKWLVRTLTDLDADLVAFQEVFHQSELVRVLEKTPGAPRLVAVPEAEETLDTPQVALASRIPLLHSEFIRDVPPAGQVTVSGDTPLITSFSRPVLHATFMIGAARSHLFVVHLKSKRGELLDDEEWSDPCARARARARALAVRTAEAVGLRSLVLDRANGEPTIVLGDLNDDEQSVTTHIITDDPSWRGPMSPGEPDPGALFSVRELAHRPSSAPALLTHRHRGRWDALDHILVSTQFCGGEHQIAEVESVRVLNDHLTGVRTMGSLTSDHAPLLASFSIRE